MLKLKWKDFYYKYPITINYSVKGELPSLQCKDFNPEYTLKLKSFNNTEGWIEPESCEKCPICKEPLIINSENTLIFCSNKSCNFSWEIYEYKYEFSKEQIEKYCYKKPNVSMDVLGLNLFTQINNEDSTYTIHPHYDLKVNNSLGCDTGIGDSYTANSIFIKDSNGQYNILDSVGTSNNTYIPTFIGESFTLDSPIKPKKTFKLIWNNNLHFKGYSLFISDSSFYKNDYGEIRNDYFKLPLRFYNKDPKEYIEVDVNSYCPVCDSKLEIQHYISSDLDFLKCCHCDFEWQIYKEPKVKKEENMETIKLRFTTGFKYCDEPLILNPPKPWEREYGTITNSHFKTPLLWKYKGLGWIEIEKSTPCPVCGGVWEFESETTYLKCNKCAYRWELYKEPEKEKEPISLNEEERTQAMEMLRAYKFLDKLQNNNHKDSKDNNNIINKKEINIMSIFERAIQLSTQALKNGAKLAVAKTANLKLISFVKKIFGKHYPSFFAQNSIGKKLEPLFSAYIVLFVALQFEAHLPPNLAKQIQDTALKAIEAHSADELKALAEELLPALKDLLPAEDK